MLRNARNLTGVFTVAAALLLHFEPADAQAAFIPQDSHFGAGTVTLDSDTGLEWLDLTESVGLSPDEVLAELGEGGLFEGFGYARRDDLEELFFRSAGITSGLQDPAEPAVFELANLLGITDDFFLISYGHFLLDGPSLNAGLASLQPLIPFGDIAASRVTIDDTGFQLSDAEATVGSFLIRGGTASRLPVPEPDSGLLLIPGLAALIFGCRRKRSLI